MTPMEKLRGLAREALHNGPAPKPKMTNQPRIQPNGEVHYTRKGEAPPDLRGFERRHNTGPDAWKFVPTFPPCVHRTIQLYRRGCGSTGVHLVCNLTKAICTHENWNPCKDIA